MRAPAVLSHVVPRRIAFIVSPWYAVPPSGYGGIELMVYNLSRELSRRGHQVTVIGRQGSQGPYETLAIAPESWSRQLGTRDQIPRMDLFIYRAYEIMRRRAFDVIHDHSGPAGILVAATSKLQTPIVATLHGSLTEAEGDFLAAIDRDVNLVAISRAQQSMVAGVEWRGGGYKTGGPGAFTPGYQREGEAGYIPHQAAISPAEGQTNRLE